MEPTTAAIFGDSAEPLNQFDIKFINARSYKKILDVIDNVLCSDAPLSDANERLFYDALFRSFDKSTLRTEGKINLLSAVADRLGANGYLYNAVVDKACEIIDDTEGSAPSSVAGYGRHPA